jgi:hypothetical protein
MAGQWMPACQIGERLLERAHVARHTSKTKLGRGWFAGLAAAPMAMILGGCAPEGTGTIKVGNPADVRAKAEASEAAPNKPVSAKQAKALQNEEAAKKKTPKLY